MNYSKYLVNQGDNLYKIANKFGISVKDLMSANGLTGSLIYPNQVLLIPNETVSNEIVVGYGESVKDILDKYDLDEEDIYHLKLVPEQIISKRNRVYRITDSISIDEILRKNNLTSDELLRLNQNRWLKNGNDVIVG